MNAFCSRIFRLFGACALAMICCQCATKKRIIVSVAEQRMVLMDDGELVKSYPVSTSRFGLGDRPGSKKNPDWHDEGGGKDRARCAGWSGLQEP